MRRRTPCLLLSFQTAAVALGCAFSGACAPLTAAGYQLSNQRDRPLTIQLRRAHGCEGEVDLSKVEEFAKARVETLAPQGSLTFEVVGFADLCGAVWLKAEGLFDAVLAWHDIPVRAPLGDPRSYSVVVEPRALRLPAGLAALPPPQ